MFSSFFPFPEVLFSGDFGTRGGGVQLKINFLIACGNAWKLFLILWRFLYRGWSKVECSMKIFGNFYGEYSHVPLVVEMAINHCIHIDKFWSVLASWDCWRLKKNMKTVKMLALTVLMLKQNFFFISLIYYLLYLIYYIFPSYMRQVLL